MPLPRSLTLVTDREELADLVTRCALSFDVNDRELFLSVWTTSDPGNVDATVAGVTTKGVDELCRKCFDPVGPMDTHHSIASIRVDIHEGGNTAQITCATLAQHFRAGDAFKNTPGADNFFVGSMHDFRAMKEKDGVWKLNAWTLEPKFAHGHPAIMPNLPEGGL